MITAENLVVVQVFQAVSDKCDAFGMSAIGNYAAKRIF
jgi:hypothetical protein